MAFRTFTDQMNREVRVNFPPRRIVSLVPSQTELLFDLGLDAEVVGITKFCIHPRDRFKTTPKVGGTKLLHMDRIRELQPDLILGNKEENEREQIEALMKEFPVWMSDIVTLEDALGMIEGVGEITGKTAAARSLTGSIRSGFGKLAAAADGGAPVRALYLIWKDPYMAAGPGTFIDQVMQAGGWENVVTESRYPEVPASAIRDMDPDVVFLSSEPYPFRDRHLAEIREICPRSTVMLVDGELFSWYGSRLMRTPEYLVSLKQAVNQGSREFL